MINSRVIILSFFVFLFLCGCVQNLHKNPVSPEETFFSDHESSPDPATTSDNVASDISSPTDAFDLSELPEKVGTEDQNSSLAGPDSQNHESKNPEQGEKIQSFLEIRYPEQPSHRFFSLARSSYAQP